jgi:cytochrome c biogenesis protein CcdA
VLLQESPFAGGLLLFLYSCGYVAPLLVAATATVSALCLSAVYSSRHPARHGAIDVSACCAAPFAY